MEKIYEKIWELAKPYYKKGREMDIDHVEWMIEKALLVCEKEEIDDSLLVPLVILHDVGYAEVKGDPFKRETRKEHMKAGAKIAREILEEVGYDKEKTEKIVYYVSVHDIWALGKIKVYEDLVLGVFKDLDFIWVITPKGLPAMLKLTGKNKKEFLDEVKAEAKPAGKEGFSTKTTKKLFEKYLKELNE